MRRGNKQSKVYGVGDRPTLYINKDCPQELIDLINEQSDLTLFFMHSMELFYKEYGVTDCEEILPRKYKFLEGISKGNSQNIKFETPTKKPTPVQKKTPEVREVENDIEEENEILNIEVDDSIFSDDDDTNEEKEANVVEKTSSNSSWAAMNLEDDPYA